MAQSDYPKTLVDGANCRVDVHERVARVLQKARTEDWARARRILQRLADEGEQVLHSEQFKFEGRFPTGKGRGGKAVVWAVRGHQLRIYGGFLRSEKRVFACVDADIKKQDKADQERLKNAALLLGELNHD